MIAELSKPITKDFSPEKLDAIFGHPDCQKLFNERAAEVRIAKSVNATSVKRCISLLMPEISYKELDFTPQEFTILLSAFTGNQDLDIHTGIIIKVINIILASRPKDFCITYSHEDYLSAISACHSVRKEIDDLIIPIRDEVVFDFWNNANAALQNEINRRVEQMKQGSKMPGNMDIDMFNQFKA